MGVVYEQLVPVEVVYEHCAVGEASNRSVSGVLVVAEVVYVQLARYYKLVQLQCPTNPFPSAGEAIRAQQSVPQRPSVCSIRSVQVCK